MSVERAVYVVRCRGLDILRQLRLEEALLRCDHRNWCIVNDGAPPAAPPAIVMGISGKVPELVNVEKALQAGVPVIKRYSGGGTVIVDQDTIFASLLFNRDAVPGQPAFPRDIMNWTETLYQPAFAARPGFRLREHDYVYGEHKFGGNAQSITKGRWVHHTSLLWDFHPPNMELLKFPPKSPDYRKGRSHLDFLCTLREAMGDGCTRQGFIDALVDCLRRQQFVPVEASIEQAEQATRSHGGIKQTKLMDLNLFRAPAQPTTATAA